MEPVGSGFDSVRPDARQRRVSNPGTRPCRVTCIREETWTAIAVVRFRYSAFWNA